MSDDVNSYCRQCTTCQATKLPTPTPAPLTNTLIGRPWQMVAVDVLEVPMSYRQNCYLLVVQDYFTKWAHAIPMPNQTAPTITAELVKVFSMFGCLIMHEWSDACVVGPGTRVGPGVEFEIDLSLFVAPWITSNPFLLKSTSPSGHTLHSISILHLTIPKMCSHFCLFDMVHIIDSYQVINIKASQQHWTP